MGATVTTNKAVMGFSTKDHKVIYVLAEQTFEKNVHPHRPNWDVFAIGTYQEVLSKVYARASAAEGGALQNRANDLTPEKYLRGWQLAFNKPMYYPDRAVSIQILARDSWRDGIESQKANLVFNALTKIKRLDIWEKLISDAGVVQMSLHHNIDVISELFGVDGIESPWKIISFSDYENDNQVIDPSLIPNKNQSGIAPVSLPALAKLRTSYQTDVYVRLDSDGRYKNPLSDYVVVGNFIRNDALNAELQSTGEGIKSIKRLREILDQQVDMTDDLEAFIDKNSVSEKLVDQFEYNVGIKFKDAENVHKLPSARFGIERISSNLEVYFIPKKVASPEAFLKAA